MELTKHFVKRWKQRVGTPLPTCEQVERIVAESIVAQHFKVFTLYNRAVVKKLAIYVHPGCKLIFKIDEMDNKAVTVLSERCLEN